MNTKNLMVSICTIAIALFLVVTITATAVSACECTPCDNPESPSCECECSEPIVIPTYDIANCTEIEVNGISIGSNPSVIAGEDADVKVTFVADANATDVTITVEIDTGKDSVEATTKSFDVVAGHTYSKKLSLEVPFELKDELKDYATLSVEISGEGDNHDLESEYKDLALLVQRPSYNPVVKSASVPQSIEAGETFPVELVLKNMGYNDLEDTYVTVSIPALGIESSAYFGDLVSETCSGWFCDDDEEDDTVSGRLYLEVPYEVEAGVYTLEVEVTTDDVTSKVARQIVIENDLSENVIVASSSKTVAVGQDAEYTLLLVNPTNDLKVYQVVTESNDQVSSSTENTVVAVPAGSSETVKVTANAAEEGEHNFTVTVLSGSKVTGAASLSLNAEGKAVSNPIVILTVVLAIIFLVLLVVLIVLLGKKPQKSEEFGESYY